MCSTDHTVANLAFLLRTKIETFNEATIFNRLLEAKDTLELDEKQVSGILELKAEYRKEYVNLLRRSFDITSRLDVLLCEETLDLEKSRDLVRKHADVFREQEEQFLRTAIKGQNLLTDEQIRALALLYREEQNEMAEGIRKPLNRLLQPEFSLVHGRQSQDESAEKLSFRKRDRS